MASLDGKTIAILAADGVEQIELERPRQAVEDAGGTTHVVSLDSGEIQGVESDIDKKDKIAVDKVVADVTPDDYDGLILPGGTINPDKLRADEDAVKFVAGFVQSGKPVAAICHGPVTLVEADVVRGRTLTSYASIRTDIANAGGIVADEEVVVDENLITSRSPDDLDAFCATIVEEFAADVPTVAVSQSQ
jgi:protease I